MKSSLAISRRTQLLSALGPEAFPTVNVLRIDSTSTGERTMLDNRGRSTWGAWSGRVTSVSSNIVWF